MRSTLLLGIALVAAGPLAAHDHAHLPTGRRGLEFHANKGQWPQQVLYRVMTPGGAVFVEPSAFTYVLRSGGPQHAAPQDAPHEPYREHAFRVHFEGGRARANEAVERMPHYVNYFLGNDPSKWAGRVGVSGGAELHDVYPGIDLHVHGETGLKYDWVVAPGGDAARIVLRYEGQDKLEVRDGMAYVVTSAGTLIEQRPVAWTERDGARIPVRCEFAQEGDRVRFSFPDGFDATRTLVIDPVVTFSSYVGSFADNFGCTATYDDDGHLYGAGSVFGAGYPLTLGVVQAAFGGGTIDMGVSKFAPDGTSLIWSTYIGGSDNDLPHSMVVNSDNELFILGTTGSTNFPVSTGCYDNSLGGGSAPPFGGSYGFTYSFGSDIAVVHLNADASAIIGATYVGGSANDGLNQFTPLLRNYGDPFRGEIIVDAGGNPVIATCTASSGLFTTPGASQSAFGGGLDGYIFRLDPGLSNMLWATYHGGTQNDAAYGVQVSSNGDVYVTGGALSTDLPTAGSPFQPANSGGCDGWLARYNSTGTLFGTTYFGTSGFDQAYFVQLDPQDNVYVVGNTTGIYPVSPGVFSTASGTQFLQKFNTALSASLWSTRFGSSGAENISPSAFLVSDCGQIYFSGWGGAVNPAGGGVTGSSTIGLPTTTDAYQPGTDGSDFYLMVLNADASSLAYATFFGGTATEHVDGGTSRFDKDGIVYQAVCAGCGFGATTFPTTPGAWSSTDNGMNCNLGVFKIDFEQNVQVNIDASINNLVLCLDDPVVLSAVGTADAWLWDLGDGSPTSTEVTLAHLYDEPGTYTITLIGTAVGLCVAVDTATVDITVVPPAELQPLFEAEPSGDCDAVAVELFNFSTGSSLYVWSFGDGTGSTQTNPVHDYGAPGQYTITLGLIDAICSDTAFTSQTIDVGIPGLTLDLPSPVGLCDGGSEQLDAGAGFDTYSWSTNEQTQQITVSEAGQYIVVVTDGFCTGTDTIMVSEAITYEPLGDRQFCPGQDATLTPPFDPLSITWSTGSTSEAITVEEDGLYWFDAIDAFGCPVTDTVSVSLFLVTESEAIVPNVFSPNGDKVNDVFNVTGVDAAADFQMDIYNRWGQRVFETSSGNHGWNGKLRNDGETVPDGTYFVIVTYKEFCQDKDPVTVTGHVTLLR